MMGKHVFVTVGTTKFEKLIAEVSESELLDVLHSLGYTSIQFQVGNGVYEEQHHSRVKLKYDRYFEDFQKQIEKADLVVSHAGSGSCLEVLRKQKPLIVVINEDLMDNHQRELAQQLSKEGYLKYCTPSSLKDVIKENKFTQFQRYPEPDTNRFAAYLNKCVGFET